MRAVQEELGRPLALIADLQGPKLRIGHLPEVRRLHTGERIVVTGDTNARNGELPTDIDWRGLADAQTTLVFYMSGRTAPAIAARLMESGMPPGTPITKSTGPANRSRPFSMSAAVHSRLTQRSCV